MKTFGRRGVITWARIERLEVYMLDQIIRD